MMIDFETVRSGVKAQINNWGSWMEARTLNGDMLKPWGEDKLTYEVYINLYWPNLKPRYQKALLKFINREQISDYWRDEAGRAVTEISHFMYDRAKHTVFTPSQ